jgi:hypothetical protein
VPAAPGDLDDGVSPDGVDAAALGKHAEAVLTAHRLSVDDQFLAVVQVDDDSFGAGAPRAGRVREALRTVVEPVQAGDRQEAVRGGEPGLLGAVPLQPGLGEGMEVRRGGLGGHGFSFVTGV